jgi:myo-inositol-1(or 4)-monophosphatase
MKEYGWSEYKEHAIEIAKKAGSLLLDGFSSKTSISNQSSDPRHLVTRFDLESEKLIIDAIRKKYPEHNILSEETGYIDNKSHYTWIVDPLDGTRNFVSKNPFFSISIALLYKREIVIGVIYAPVLDELYTTEKGKGAFLNGHRVSVSEVKDIKKSFIVSCEGSDKRITRSVRLFQGIRPLVIDMRKLGSAALESAWVASGRAEAYVVTKINPWDIAAGILLVEEAGGRVTDFRGKKWNLKRSDLILSNGKIHDLLLSIVNRALNE